MQRLIAGLRGVAEPTPVDLGARLGDKSDECHEHVATATAFFGHLANRALGLGEIALTKDADHLRNPECQRAEQSITGGQLSQRHLGQRDATHDIPRPERQERAHRRDFATGLAWERILPS